MPTTRRRTAAPAAGPVGRRVAADRLPRAARVRLRRLELAYLDGTDEQYQEALRSLSEVAATLAPQDLDRFDRAVAAAHERVGVEQHRRVIVRALAGPWTVVEQLPGGVDLVRLRHPDPARDDGQLLAVVPGHRAGDRPAVTARIDRERAALAAGRCPRCQAGVAGDGDGQYALRHRAGCRLGQDALDRSR